METAPTGQRGQILFVDDDRAAREGVTAMLQRHGYACESAATATEAAEKLASGRFEALISDIHMPGNTGLEFVEAMVAHSPGLPIVLLTGRPSVETAARSVRLTVTAYLTKPPDFDELGSVLDRAIANYRGFRALHQGRERLRAWERELEQMEQIVRQAPAAAPGGPLASYLRVSLQQVILMLTDLERATQTLESRSVDHLAALQRTVEVLEKTRQNFKSKDLADLRRQLEQLIGRNDSPGSGT